MQTDIEESARDQLALLAMVGLGAGEIFGAILYGIIQDKSSINTTIATNIIGAIIAFTSAITYIARYRYTATSALCMTFFWGVQDGGLNCMINSILGF